MRRIWMSIAMSLVALTLALSPAQAASQIATGVGQQFMVASNAAVSSGDLSPCDDPLFLALQKKSLDSLSIREYEYFQKKDKECSEYRASIVRGAQPTRRDDPSYGITAPRSVQYPVERRDGTANGVLFGILGTCAFLLLLSALASSGG